MSVMEVMREYFTFTECCHQHLIVSLFVYLKVMKRSQVIRCFAPEMAKPSKPSEYNWRNWPLENARTHAHTQREWERQTDRQINAFLSFNGGKNQLDVLQYLHQPLGVLHVTLPHCEWGGPNVVKNQVIQPSELLQGKIYYLLWVGLTGHVSCYIERFLSTQTQTLLCHLSAIKSHKQYMKHETICRKQHKNITGEYQCREQCSSVCRIIGESFSCALPPPICSWDMLQHPLRDPERNTAAKKRKTK